MVVKEFKINGQLMRYKDEGNGFPVIIVHGTPSSSDEFLDLIPKLTEKYRVIAPDHIGFGSSDKPENYQYTIENHQENFSQFLENLDLDKFNLVVHDFGGIIALPYVLKNLKKINSLVIMNSWAWPMSKFEYFPPWMKKVMSSSFMKYLYLKRNFSPKFFVKKAWGKYEKLTKEKHTKYCDKFKNPTERHGTWGFACALTNESADVWKIESELKNLDKISVFLLWGAADKLITLKSFDHWKSILPNAKFKKLDNVGHFIADEAPDLVAKELMEFFDK